MRTPWPLLLAVAIPASLVACKSDPQHLDVTVSWSDTRQTMDGFGASSAFFGGTLSDDVADQLFDAKKGIGLSLLRIMIGVPDDTQSDGSEPKDNAKPVATAPELYTAQQAISRGAKVWATADFEAPAAKAKYAMMAGQTPRDDAEAITAEFEALSGKCDAGGWRFNRDELHERG